MSVDFDAFLEWATDRFGDIKVKGNEIKTHSLFAPDKKYHLWMNPTGGKKNREQGVFRCWYTDTRGSLVSLVAMVDKISLDEAEERICKVSSMAKLNEKVDKYFQNLLGNTETQVQEIETSPDVSFELPPYSLLIDHCPTNFYCKKAKQYLNNRKIPSEGLYVGTVGEFKNRIILPYYDIYGDLVYYNARAIYNKEKIRYLKPSKDLINGNFLFIKEWPKPDERIYVMEGEFDALSLNLCGFKAAACGGKFLYEDQIEILRNFKVVLSFDNDKAGKRAVAEIGNLLLGSGFWEVYFVRPPNGYKDWNALIQNQSIPVIQNYIHQNERLYTPTVGISLLS